MGLRLAVSLFSVALLLGYSDVRASADEQIEFVEALKRFRESFSTNLQNEFRIGPSATNLSEVDRASVDLLMVDLNACVEKWTEELRQLYESSYLNVQGARPSAQLYTREKQLAIQMERIMKELPQLSKSLQAGTRAWKKSMKSIRRELEDIRAGRIHWYFSDYGLWLEQFFPRWTERIKVALAAIPYVMPRRSPRSFVAWLESQNWKRFSRTNTSPQIKWKGDAIPKEFFFALINHENGLLEAKIATEALRKLGAQEVFVLTYRSLWLTYAGTNKKDQSFIFIEDGDLFEQLKDRIQSSSAHRIGLVVCPEGTVSYQASNFPLSVKPGALVLARKLARYFQNVWKVKLLILDYDGHEYAAGAQDNSIHVRLEGPLEVPDHELSRNDTWVEIRRKKIENLYNSRRGLVASKAMCRDQLRQAH